MQLAPGEEVGATAGLVSSWRNSLRQGDMLEMQRIRIYAGADGGSHFSGLMPETLNTYGLRVNGSGALSVVSPQTFTDFQPVSNPQLAVITAGVHEYGTADGVRRLFPGDVLVLEDASGRGHSLAAIGIAPAVSLHFPLGNGPG
jgi:hypothetical protein